MDERNDFAVVLPIVKSEQGKNGNTWLHGVLSDDGIDLQGATSLAAGMERSLPVLRKFGKLSDDGGRTSIGEVLVADVLCKSDLIRRGVLEPGSVPDADLEDERLRPGQDGPRMRDRQDHHHRSASERE